MPILDVEIVLAAGATLRPEWPAALAAAAARVLASPPGHTWVRLRALPAAQYAENSDDGTAGGGGVPAVPGDGPAPVFVSLLLAAPPEGDARAAQARVLSKALAAVLDRPPENVHLFYEPPGAGRVAFGGVLRR